MTDQPKISDDGKFYWDGARWVPLPAAGPPAGPPQQVKVSGVVRTAPARWRYVFWTLLIGGILFIAVCSVLAAPKT